MTVVMPPGLFSVQGALNTLIVLYCIDGIGFRIWRHAFKMGAVTSLARSMHYRYLSNWAISLQYIRTCYSPSDIKLFVLLQNTVRRARPNHVADQNSVRRNQRRLQALIGKGHLLPEKAGALKMTDMKMQDMKSQDI